MMGRGHWVETPLSNLLAALESGSRPRGGVKGISEGTPSIGAEHLASDGGFNFSNLRYVSIEFARNMRRGIIAEEDVLIVKDGATTGKTSFVQTDFPYKFACVNEHVFICRAFNELSKKYIFQYLRSHEGQNQIMSTFHGGAQGGINSEFIDAVTIPLPPVNEQKRIVEKLDAILPMMKSAKARLAKIPGILKKFRQSVLAAACSGRLTEDWREGNPNVEKASELLKRMEEERIDRWKERNPKRKYVPPNEISKEEFCELPSSWIWTNLDCCSWEITVGHVGPMKDKYISKGIAFYRSQNIRPLKFCEDGLVYIDSNFHSSLRKSALYGGEILVTRSGANVGDCCINPSAGKEANCSDLVITRPLFGLVSKYGAIYISSPFGQTQIGLKQTGMAQPHFNISAMRVSPFPLPPLPEQHEIVRRAEKLFVLADSLEAKYKKALARVEKIEQAVLAKAFRGELVEPDPNDEPAEELLKRILAEKVKLEAGKRTRKKK